MSDPSDKALVTMGEMFKQHGIDLSPATTEPPAEEEQPAQPAEEDETPTDEASMQTDSGEDEAPESDGDEEEGQTPSVLSQLDIESLSDEDFDALINSDGFREKYSSRVQSRIKKLADQKNEALQKLEELEKKMASGGDAKDNPFANTKLEDIESAYENLRSFSKEAKQLLREHANADDDEIIYQKGDVSWTKAQVEAAQEDTIEALNEHLPKRLKQLQELEQGKAQRKAMEKQTRTLMPWVENQDSPQFKFFETLRSDPRWAKLEQADPTVPWEAIQMHVANSYALLNSKAKPSAKPSAAASAAKPPSTDKRSQAEKLLAGFSKQPTADNFAAALIAASKKG